MATGVLAERVIGWEATKDPVMVSQYNLFYLWNKTFKCPWQWFKLDGNGFNTHPNGSHLLDVYTTVVSRTQETPKT